MLAIIDLDGSCCDWRNRAKRAGATPDREHKEKFQMWLDSVQSEKTLAQDKPIKEVISVVLSLIDSNHKVVFLTGRCERYRKVTEKWLRDKAGIEPVLLMRGDEDYRSAHEYKRSRIKELMKKYKGLPVITIDDDYDGDCASMYKELGVIHLKVMPL